ncbi:hypothetical protein C8R43DRAFT_871280 [Mycena crocata]|nr:hypothetical protein C8R43DRAFT_871280 [Mycena crocata]
MLDTGQDATMDGWRPHASRFLDELMRQEGLGNSMGDTGCPCCQRPYERRTRRFWCQDCGNFVQCLDCVKSRHTTTPLHRLKEWNGNYWTGTTLYDLDVEFQLGHGGLPCRRPAPKQREMVVMDVKFVHRVRFRYCACDENNDALNLEQLLRMGWYPATVVDPETCATFAALDFFRLLSVVANVNVRDFVSTLERNTNANATESVPVCDRYKAFGRMSRQWGFLKRMMRAGCAQHPGGMKDAKRGEAAVECWTCPHDGKNIPDGWREVDAEFRFLYMLILALDANFRMKSRLRRNARVDKPLGAGLGYMLDGEPYREHLKDYVAEKDVSTCIAFAALLQKDTRVTTGLRCSGVGGVVCARHEVVRPQGIGDLQKGERYANMDYILLASIVGVAAMYIAISYDIACQWKINLPTRMMGMPDEMKLDLNKVKVEFALPVWHAAAHERKCQVQNSLTYIPGVARTDGEGIERLWSRIIRLAWASKEMNIGAREDAIEELIDYLNYERNIQQGTTLPLKLVVALDERDRQRAGFEEVDGSVAEATRKKWEKKITDWVGDRMKPNPYEIEGGRSGGPTEAEIRLRLTKDEAADTAGGGGGTLSGSSVTSFLVTGLHLEEEQRRIRRESKGRALLPASLDEKMEEMRVAFFSRLSGFRKLQEVYMRAAVRLLEEAEDGRDAELPPERAEDVTLYLPSDLTAADRESGCRAGLGRMEAKLREGQCQDGIDYVRNRLHAKRHLLMYRPTNVAGQRGGKRSNTLLERVGERVLVGAQKYRRAREALIALRGAEACTEYKALADEDLILDEERENDARARKKLGNIGSGKSTAKRQGPAISSKEKRMSWIWTAGGGPGKATRCMIVTIRVEWSKAKARKERWEEEVALLEEEMRRVLRYLRWRALWWEKRRGMRTEKVSVALRAGLDAHATRHAAMCRDMGRRFKKAWDTSAEEVVRAR